MRKSITLLYLLFLLAITGCETDKIIFSGPYFVRFTDVALSQKESYSKVISIEVHNAGPAPTSDLTLTYTISGNAREGVDFTIVGERGKITIAKGTYFGMIQVKLINNANNILRSQDVIFTLQTTSSNELKVGQGESSIGKAFTLTILDDCILGGTYDGASTTGSKKNLSVVSTDCETYTLSDWNIGVFNTSTQMDLKFIDNDDNTLTIPEQEEENLDPDKATIKGIGVVDPSTRIITITITLVDYDNEEATFTLTPN